MNLVQLFGIVESLGAEITLEGDVVEITEPASGHQELIEAVEFHEQELLAILQGKTVNDAGNCDDCGETLISLKTFDGFINRTCGNCGKWFRCVRQTSLPFL